MANGHGGSRTPAQPAPVSGPGALSQRTDGKQPIRDLTGLPYGEGQAYHDLQASAPMEAAPPATPRPAAGQTAAPVMPMPTPMGAPTQLPQQPLTAGSPFGPGPGPEVLAQNPDQYQNLRAALPTLVKLADLPTTSPATRNVIRYLRGIL